MTRKNQKRFNIGLLIILALCILGVICLTMSGRETPEFIKAVAYAIAGALCSQFIFDLPSKPTGNNH